MTKPQCSVNVSGLFNNALSTAQEAQYRW